MVSVVGWLAQGAKGFLEKEFTEVKECDTVLDSEEVGEWDLDLEGLLSPGPMSAWGEGDCLAAAIFSVERLVYPGLQPTAGLRTLSMVEAFLLTEVMLLALPLSPQ